MAERLLFRSSDVGTRAAPSLAALPALANGLIALCLGLVATGCTPTHFGLRPQRDDPQLARATAERAAAVCAERRRADLPPHAFTSDGCSVWPDRNWIDCCLEHDIAYWCGGSAAARQKADERLRACVAAHGATCTARLMYMGVRMGGIPWQPFPWRWAYGWSGVHGYDEDDGR